MQQLQVVLPEHLLATCQPFPVSSSSSLPGIFCQTYFMGRNTQAQVWAQAWVQDIQGAGKDQSSFQNPSGWKACVLSSGPPGYPLRLPVQIPSPHMAHLLTSFPAFQLCYSLIMLSRPMPNSVSFSMEMLHHSSTVPCPRESILPESVHAPASNHPGLFNTAAQHLSHASRVPDVTSCSPGRGSSISSSLQQNLQNLPQCPLSHRPSKHFII